MSDAAVLDERRGDFQTSDQVQIYPGDASQFALIVTMPQLSADDQRAIDSATQTLSIIGEVTFDTGFHSVDTLRLLGACEPKEKRWVRIDDGIEADLLHAPNLVNK